MSYDILRINQVRDKILNSIILFEQKYGKKGATQYDLGKKLGKNERVAGSTFNENISTLEELGLVSKVQDKNNKHHHWRKKNHRVSHPYTITNLGVFACLKSLSAKKILDSENNLLIPYLPDFIKNHWYELEKIFDEALPFLLEESANQISVVQTQTSSMNLVDVLSGLLAKSLEEKTEFYFQEANIKFVLLNVYNILNAGNREFLQGVLQRLDEDLQSSGVLPQKPLVKELDISINNYTMNRLVFVFYFNLLRLCMDSEYPYKFATDFFLSKFPPKLRESVDDKTKRCQDLCSFIFPFMEKMRRGSKSIINIIKNDEALSLLMKKNLEEISTRFKFPSSLEPIMKMF